MLHDLDPCKSPEETSHNCFIGIEVPKDISWMQKCDRVFQASYQPASEECTEDSSDHYPCTIGWIDDVSLFLPKQNVVTKSNKEAGNFSNGMQQYGDAGNMYGDGKLQLQFFSKGKKRFENKIIASLKRLYNSKIGACF